MPIIKILLSGGTDFFIVGLKDKKLIESIALTFYASLVATAIGIFFGIPLGYVFAKYNFPFKNLFEAIVDIPVVIPHTAAGIALLTVFGRRTFIGSMFDSVGISFLNSKSGIILAMTYVSIPFLVNQVKEGFKKIDSNLENVSRTLGANKLKTFFRISLPLVKTDIFSGSIMMWARGISEFGAIIILTYNPKVISTLIYDRFESFGLKHSSPSVAFLLFIIVILFIIFRLLAGRKREDA